VEFFVGVPAGSVSSAIAGTILLDWLLIGVEGTPPSPSILRKVFKVDALSPDLGERRFKKSYKVWLASAKYS
jgi:hypothetical protein